MSYLREDWGKTTTDFGGLRGSGGDCGRSSHDCGRFGVYCVPSGGDCVGSNVYCTSFSDESGSLSKINIEANLLLSQVLITIKESAKLMTDFIDLVFNDILDKVLIFLN